MWGEGVVRTKKKTTQGGYLRRETDGRGVGERGRGKEGVLLERRGWGC